MWGCGGGRDLVFLGKYEELYWAFGY